MAPSAFRTLLMDRVRAFDKFAHQDMQENPEDYASYTQNDWEELWQEYSKEVLIND